MNTQRRDNVRKRVIDTLAWKYVLLQLDTGSDQYNEAETLFREAEKKLDSEIEKAFQHVAYLVRTDQNEVDFDRFDDDTRTALKGNHIWEMLVAKGRATQPGELSGTYLKTLLADRARNISLRELVQQFTKNPSFPMVSSESDIRSAIFDLVTQSAAYDLVDESGELLNVTSAQDLTLGAGNIYLQKRIKIVEIEPIPRGPDTPTERRDTGPTVYKRYSMKLTNRSLTSSEARDSIWHLINSLADVLDPAFQADVQLLTIDLQITAAEGCIDEFLEKVHALEGKVSEQDAI